MIERDFFEAHARIIALVGQALLVLLSAEKK